MKFGQEFQDTLQRGNFPPEWLDAAIEYKSLKKCIKKVHKELESIGLEPNTLGHFTDWLEDASAISRESSGASVKSNSSGSDGDQTNTGNGQFEPYLRVLIDKRTGEPLDATLTPETKASLKRLASTEKLTAFRRREVGDRLPSVSEEVTATTDNKEAPQDVPPRTSQDCAWIQLPLASAQRFFELLEPKMEELEALNKREEQKLEDQIMDLGDQVQDVIEPVRDGYEAKRKVSYRDLYFWREMFRLYLEKPIFFSSAERNRGALKFDEAKARLEEYDKKLRSTGLLDKMKTPLAKAAAKQFLDLNVDILRIMHFQEMNSRAMRKILKKFDKRTHLEGKNFIKSLQVKYPALEQTRKGTAGAFANSIARDLNAEVASKVLAIVPQLDDWNCPVCYSMACKPVNLGCCRSVFCISCIISLQSQGVKRCPVCNTETVSQANGNNIDFDTMDFLEKYFPLETKTRQKENERAQMIRDYGEEFVKPGCAVM